MEMRPHVPWVDFTMANHSIRYAVRFLLVNISRLTNRELGLNTGWSRRHFSLLGIIKLRRQNLRSSTLAFALQYTVTYR
jgi:hypothetical protein